MQNCESIKQMAKMRIPGVYVLASKAKNGMRAVYSENYEYRGLTKTAQKKNKTTFMGKKT